MALPSTEWFGRHRRVVIALFALMLVVIAVESLLLYQQSMDSKAIKPQSDKLLATFLLGDTAQARGIANVHIRLQNVRFKWSDKVYIDVGSMTLHAVPLQGTMVNFDDPGSFHLIVHRSAVFVRPDVMAGMCNESIFNYSESHVRKVQVSIEKDDNGRRTVKLKGKIKFVTWIPFTMLTRLSVDTKANALVITVDHLKVFGFISLTKLIRSKSLQLDRLISLPPNKSLLVDGNRIVVKPLALFPPPRINGKIANVDVNDSTVSIKFAGDAITAPESSARNYVYLRGGASRFGRFRMADTDLLILDQNPANPFVFSLLHYAEMIPKSTFEIPDTKSARITMPDI